MTDIATIWNPATGTADWALDPARVSLWTDAAGASIVDEHGRPIDASFTAGSGLVTGGDLYSAVLISLFSDAVAGSDDVVARSDDPRGWWAGPIGSRLWLRMRSKATPAVLATVKDDVAQALAWLIEDDVVAAIDVVTEWTRPGLLGCRVTLRRADGARVALAFERVWEGL